MTSTVTNLVLQTIDPQDSSPVAYSMTNNWDSWDTGTDLSSHSSELQRPRSTTCPRPRDLFFDCRTGQSYGGMSSYNPKILVPTEIRTSTVTDGSTGQG